MPEVSRIYSIINQGRLPKTAHELVNQWRLMHLRKLRGNWNRARRNESVLPMEPLE